MSRKLVSLLTALALALTGLLSLGCAAADSVTVTDMTGREVTLPERADRIVALTASDCEILYAVGAGDTLVGRGEYCDYPEEVLDVPSVQSGYDTNIEQIIALEPQVLLMSTMAQTQEQVDALEEAGIPSPTGKDKWHPSTINSMLTNPCYKGLTIRQKTFTTDFLTHKSKKNEGELPQYIIENSHTPIIPEETWELVQLERERRGRMGNRFSAKGPLASRLVCADCGAFFGAKVWHSTDSYRTTVWRCNDKYKPGISRASGGEKCCTGHVTEEQVYGAFGKIVDQLIAQRPEVVEACEEVLRTLMSTGELEVKKERLVAEQKRITERVEKLMNRASREVVGDFAEAYGKLEAEMSRVAGKLEAVEKEKGEREYRERQCRLFLKTISNLGGDDGESAVATAPEGLADSDLFLALVDKVIVGEEMRFVLRNGTERVA